MRKLASIQQVLDVQPIYHPADGSLTTLDLVTFADIAWKCVAKRGEFGPGDLAVYIEISTVVPECPEFEFLRAKKFKVKTVRLCGQLSQGLALPVSVILSIVPEFRVLDLSDLTLNVGDDVSDLLGVTRYEPPVDAKINGSGSIAPFPDDVCPRTDELRIQSIPHILEAFNGKGVVATEKEDGTSVTYFWDSGKMHVRVCSRNTEKVEPDDSVYWKILELYPDIVDFCLAHPEFVLQGEITGPGIQKNRMGRSAPHFSAFNLYDRTEGNYVPHSEAQRLVEGVWGIPWVKVVYFWPEFNSDVVTIESLLEDAKGTYEGTKNPREGIVLRLLYEERWSYLLSGRISCKVINNDFLEKGGE